MDDVSIPANMNKTYPLIDAGGGTQVDVGNITIAKDANLELESGELVCGAVTNSGTFKIDGDEWVTATGDVTNNGVGKIELMYNATLDGNVVNKATFNMYDDSTVTGNVDNSGDIIAEDDVPSSTNPHHIWINGTFAQHQNGGLVLAYHPESQDIDLLVCGKADLAGTLVIQVTPGGAPLPASTVFVPVTFGSRVPGTAFTQPIPQGQTQVQWTIVGQTFIARYSQSQVKLVPRVVLQNDNAEGGIVSQQFQLTDDPNVTLTCGATNLPAGLSINRNTGLITGNVAYTDAETNGGSYDVMVTGTQGAEVESQEITWTITDTNRLDNPGFQASDEGDTVSLQLQTIDNSGTTLTYSATGLPPGLSINSSTGLISGTVSYTAAENNGGIYTVTISVSSAVDTDYQTFDWGINPMAKLVEPGNPINYEGQFAVLGMGVTGIKDHTLSFSFTGLPPGVTFDNVSWVISGTLPVGSAGNYAVTVKLYSDGDLSDTLTFNWSIFAN